MDPTEGVHGLSLFQSTVSDALFVPARSKVDSITGRDAGTAVLMFGCILGVGSYEPVVKNITSREKNCKGRLKKYWEKNGVIVCYSQK